MGLSHYRIGLFGKGGSGKSSVTVLLARALAARGYQVCVLDADSTNVGLHQALDIAAAPRPLLDYFGGMVFSGGAVTCPVDDPTLLAGAAIGIDRLPAEYVGRSEEGIVLLTAGKIGDKGPGAGCDGPIAKIARDLQPGEVGANAVMLVDFKAGFEDSARGAIVNLDWVLLVVDPTQAALQMAAQMQEMVAALRRGAPPATAHLETAQLAALAQQLFRNARLRRLLTVLNKVPDGETERYMREVLTAVGIEPLAAFVPDDGIAGAWLRGRPLAPAPANIAAVEQLVNRLEALAAPEAAFEQI